MIEVQTTSGGRLLLDEIADRAEHPEPALKAVGDAFRQREARVFATANGGSWAPDDPATVKIKGSTRVLVDDGGLLRSLTNRGDYYHVEDLTGDSIVLGTRNPVAHLHQKGARGMPYRNPVPPTTYAERQLYATGLLDYFVDGQTS